MNASDNCISISRHPKFFQKIDPTPVTPTSQNFFSRISDFIFRKNPDSRGGTPITDEISSSSSNKDFFKNPSIKVYPVKTTEEDSEEEIVENLADMEQAWEIIDTAQAFASRRDWQQAHDTLLSIQSDFWRNAGYMTCAKVAANVVIDSQSMKDAHICFSFCDKLSDPEQRAQALEVIETMLYQVRKVTISEIDDAYFDPQLHPFKQAKNLALSGFWGAAEQIISQIEIPFWRDRGYSMLAKMSAEAALDPQKRMSPSVSFSLCDKISDADQKRQTIRLVQEILPDAEVEETSVLGEQLSSVAQTVLVKQGDVLSSKGLWRQAHISISTIRSPKARDLAWSNAAKKAAASKKSQVAYEYCDEIQDRFLKTETKAIVDGFLQSEKKKYSLFRLINKK